MKINWLPLAAAVAFAAGSVSASAVDFNGYFRAGAQVNADRGEVYCLGTGADGHKVGRLRRASGASSGPGCEVRS